MAIPRLRRCSDSIISNVDNAPAASRTAWAWISATFFGVGMMGKGGGTVASAIVAAAWLLAISHHQALQPWWVTAVAALLATAIGIPGASVVARELGKKDPSEVVMDEVAGQLIALIAAPMDWKYVLASFILFRGFDIFKPPPVRQLESLPSGWGIMMDDVAAGLYALLILRLLLYVGLIPQ